MFYFFLAPLLSYHWLLIIAAIVPAVFLMIKVYRSDRLEREDPALLRRLVLVGVLSTFIALVLEWIGEKLLGLFFDESSQAYMILLYFVVVGLVEEGAKYYVLKKTTWSLYDFNCQYDGVVYAVFVSLGFAVWENISYVLHYGFSTALIRAVTAIPGHACFGVFMGVFYGLARGYEYLEERQKAKLFRVFAVVIPTLIHGTYDYIASMGTQTGDLYFILFVAVLFILSFVLVHRLAKNDHYFSVRRRQYRPF